jgi:hypothetical protein
VIWVNSLILALPAAAAVWAMILSGIKITVTMENR